MKLITLVAFLTATLFIQAQQISGKVIDATEAPIEFGSVRLFSLPDSTVKTGAYTDIDGNFLLDEFPPGNYFVKVTFASHEAQIIGPFEIKKSEKKKLGTIQMQLDKAINLDEVTVTGSLDELKSGIDKKIYSVEQDISVRGGTANDVLNNIPSIEIDQDGNVSLRGDANVTVLINGRPSTLAAGDGQNLLDALPANSIEKIEVVTNPSAKYDPDGTSGIINIVLKKNRARGFNGLASLTAATGHLYQGSLALSYQGKKTNTYLNYSFDYYQGFRNNYNQLYRTYDNDSTIFFDQQREGTDEKLGNTVVLGNDWNINKRNLVTISATGNLGSRTRTGDLENFYYAPENVLYERWDRISRDPRDNANVDLNLGYTHSFKEDLGEWSFNANQSYGDQNVYGFYEEIYLNLDGSESNKARLNQRLDNHRTNQITTVQTDMNRVFEGIKARMETGVKMILESEMQSTYSETQDTITGEYFADTLANFDYNYDEAVYSAYGIFGQELGKFKYQVGVRGEIAQQTPELPKTGEVYRNEYLNLFPSAHIKYDVNDDNRFSFSYSRRINRASSRQMNPFASYSNPFNIRRGNPELQPEYIDSYDLGYSMTKKKLIFTASIFHRRTTDVINRVREYYPNNVSVLTYANIDKSVSTGFETIGIYKTTKWWKNTISFNGNYINYTSSDTTVDWNNDGFNWRVKWISNIDFWKKTASLQFNAQYNAPWVRPQGIVQPRMGIDIAAEKRLMDKKLTVGLRVTDIFNRKGFLLEFEEPGIRQFSEFKFRTRRIYVNVSYRFGSSDNKIKAPRISSGGGGME